MARILFLGLGDKAGSSKHAGLRAGLENSGHSVVSGEATVLSTVDLAFCDGDAPDYRVILKSLQALQPSLPAVVVTLLPDEHKWLDALEAGAADYCSAPFEAAQLRWIVDGLTDGRAAYPRHRTAQA